MSYAEMKLVMSFLCSKIIGRVLRGCLFWLSGQISQFITSQLSQLPNNQQQPCHTASWSVAHSSDDVNLSLKN